MPRCQGLLNEVDQVLTQSLTYTRTLVADLAPPALRDFGLLGGLEWLVGQMRHIGLAVSLHTSLKQLQLPEHETILLFQTVRELLTNVMKHAQSDDVSGLLGAAYRYSANRSAGQRRWLRPCCCENEYGEFFEIWAL